MFAVYHGGMRLLFWMALACAGNAAAILQTGDSVSFAISDRSFVFNSQRLGGPPAPTGISFQFFTAPLAGSTQFDATLESADGSVAVAVDNLTFVPGTFQGAEYRGMVSSLNGRFTLPEAVSAALFANSQAVLVLQNEGPAVALGLASYSLPQELEVSLSAGNFSVGALELGPAFASVREDAPEPDYGWVSGVVGLAFLAAGLGLKRFCRGPAE